MTNDTDTDDKVTFNIADYEPAQDGRLFQVVTPDGKTLDGVTITLLGADSDVYRKLSNTQGNRRLTAVTGRRGGITTTMEEVDNDGLNALVAATVAWTGFEEGGQPIPCTPKNARRLYTRLPWLRRAADAFVNNDANFLKASSKP